MTTLSPSPAGKPVLVGELDGTPFDEQIEWGVAPRVVRCDPGWKHAALARCVEALRRARSKRTSDTCIIVGNGPSLKWVNQALLGRYPVFASNYAYLDPDLFRHVVYYTVVNPLVAEQAADEINRLNGPQKFFPYWLAYCLNEEAGANFMNARGGVPEFSTDAEEWISWSATVSFFNLQIAYYLGFKRALLVGFDHAYLQPAGATEGDIIQSKEDDINHFSTDYFRGKAWQAADIFSMERAYLLAEESWRADRRVIKNCTVGGSLEVFERGYLEAEVLRPSDTALYAVPQWGEVKMFETVNTADYSHVCVSISDARLAGQYWKRLVLKVQSVAGGQLLEVRPADCLPPTFPGFPMDAPVDDWGPHLRLPLADTFQASLEFQKQTVSISAAGRDILAMIVANLDRWMAQAQATADKADAALLQALRQETPNPDLIERRLFG